MSACCCQRTATAPMTVSAVIFVLAVVVVTGVSGECLWDGDGRRFSCPDDVAASSSALAASAGYTRCCTLEAPAYVDTFVTGFNFGTPACCVPRTAAHTNAANTPPPLPATLRGPTEGTSPPGVTRPTAVFLHDANIPAASSEDEGGLSTNAIIGIAVTCVAGLLIVIIVIYIIVSLARGKSDDAADDNQYAESQSRPADGQKSPYARRKHHGNSRTNLMCIGSATAV